MTGPFFRDTGGELYGSANPYNRGRVVNSVTGYTSGNVRLDVAIEPGYAFVGFREQGGSAFLRVSDLPFTGSSPTYARLDEVSSMEAVFEEQAEYTLTVELDGDDVPCSGHVTVDPARKYYAEGTWVTLTAVPSSGCCNDFEYWSARQSLLDKFGKKVDGQYSDSITIRISQDTTIHAKFRDLKVGPVSDGMIVHYVQPYWWDNQGYYGDRFHQQLTVDVPAGWSWEGVEVGEKLCYISDTLGGLSDAEITQIEASEVGEFRVVAGKARFPKPNSEPDEYIEKPGLWLVGLDNFSADNHYIAAQYYPTVLDYLDSGDPAMPGSIKYRQLYYISDPGQNTVSFGRKYIAEVVIELKLVDLPVNSGGNYTPTFARPAHLLVDKGGAHNPVAWGAIPNWLGDDYWDGLSFHYFGYGISGNADDEKCGLFSGCYPIYLKEFSAIVVPDEP